jgi:hypothetical protein
MKQTAVEWLIKQLELEYNSFPLLNAEACIKAKEMEKDQICEAYAIGGSPLLGPWEFGEEYYNNTFKTKTDEKDNNTDNNSNSRLHL